MIILTFFIGTDLSYSESTFNLLFVVADYLRAIQSLDVVCTYFNVGLNSKLKVKLKVKVKKRFFI